MQGRNQAVKLLAEAQDYYDRIKAIADKGASSTSTVTGTVGARTVNIVIRGHTTPINVASGADGDALVALLNQLANAKATAS